MARSSPLCNVLVGLAVQLVFVAIHQCDAQGYMDTRGYSNQSDISSDISTVSLVTVVENNATLVASMTTPGSSPRPVPQGTTAPSRESTHQMDLPSSTPFLAVSTTEVNFFSTAQSYVTNATSPDVDLISISKASVTVDDVIHDLLTTSQVDKTSVQYQTSSIIAPEVTSFQPSVFITSTDVATERQAQNTSPVHLTSSDDVIHRLQTSSRVDSTSSSSVTPEVTSFLSSVFITSTDVATDHQAQNTSPVHLTSSDDVIHRSQTLSRVDSTSSSSVTPEVTSFLPSVKYTSTEVTATSFLSYSLGSVTINDVTKTSHDAKTVASSRRTSATDVTYNTNDLHTSSKVGNISAEHETSATTTTSSTPVVDTDELTTALPVWPLSVAVLAGSVAAISLILVILVILLIVFVCRCRARRRRSFKGDSKVRFRNDTVRIDVRKRSKRPPSSPDGCDFDGSYTPLARSAPPSSAMGADNIFKGSFPQHQDSRTDVNNSTENLSPADNLYEKDSDVDSLNVFSMSTFSARNAAYKGYRIDQSGYD